MKTNIQEYPDAVMLTEWSTKCTNPADEKTRYIYAVKSTGMLYEVDPVDGTITGQRYILDISFTVVEIPSEIDLLSQLSEDIGYEPDME